MNRGIDLNREVAEQSIEDWVFGAAPAPCIGKIPVTLREHFLPVGEVQVGVEDTQDCVTRAYINALEAKFTFLVTQGKLKNRQWLEENGYLNDGRVTFSDRFIAIKSGTTRSGNSLKAPADAIYRHGLIPKSMFPKPANCTWDEYHQGITPEMEALGKEFAARFNINYEKVLEADFVKASTDDFVICAVFAWPSPVADIYPRMDVDPNHSVAIIKPEYFVFDNYEAAGTFIKQLSPNYDFWQYGYRVFISREVTPEEAQQTVTLLEKIVAALKDLWQIFNRSNVDVPANQLPMNEEPKQAPAVIVSEAAKKAIGKDLTPEDRISDNVSCVAQLVKVLEGTPYALAKDLSYTPRLLDVLKADKRWRATLTPHRGCIVVSPTANAIGHCGIFITDDDITSNDSMTGRWEQNYDWHSWISYFKNLLKLRIVLFEPVEL